MGGKRVFELILEIGHKSTPFNKKLANGYTHKWTAFVRGVNNSKIEHCIQRVVFQLHESFDTPYRDITEPPFQIKETGYAGFEIPIQIYFKNREKPNHLVFVHDLCLLTNKPNDASTIEKIKFINPNKEFEKCLVRSGAQLLTVAVKKERSDSPPAKKQKSSSLIPSKDMSKQPQPQLQSQPQLQPQHLHQTQHQHQKLSHQNHHSNHHTTKQQLHQLQAVQKPKSSSKSKEFIDVFGAPLVFSGGQKQNSKEDTPKDEYLKDDYHNNDRRKDEHRKDDHRKDEHRKDDHRKDDHRKDDHRKDDHRKDEHRKDDYRKDDHRKDDHRKDDRRKDDRRKDDRRKDGRLKDDQYVNDLQLIQTKILCLSDCDRLQKIVDIVEEAGEWYNLTPKKFEFDLKRLDKKTLSRIERCLQH